MFINESLHLYPIGPVVSRGALENTIEIRKLIYCIPKGVVLWIVLPTLHTDLEIWGPDSYKFNPDRFANWMGSLVHASFHTCTCHLGEDSACLGQNLALVQLKILITLILSNFSISLSPKYVHSHVHNVIIEPKHRDGVDLLVKKFETWLKWSPYGDPDKWRRMHFGFK